MSELTSAETASGMTREQMMSALFAQLVIQQSNMAMMLLGKVPHPETGQTVREIETAKFFIDQLEMLEVKTKGNLSREESALLKQSLMTVHMAFVETVESPETLANKPAPSEPEKKPETTTPPVAPPAEESHKKFSKKY